MERPSQISFLNKDTRGLCEYVDASTELTAIFNKIATEENITLPRTKGKCTLSFAKNILASDKLPDDVLTEIAVGRGWVAGAESSSSGDSSVDINGFDLSEFTDDDGVHSIAVGTYERPTRRSGKFIFVCGTARIVADEDICTEQGFYDGLEVGKTQLSFRTETLVLLKEDATKYGKSKYPHFVGKVNWDASPDFAVMLKNREKRFQQISALKSKLKVSMEVNPILYKESPVKAYAERNARIDARIQELLNKQLEQEFAPIPPPTF